MACSMEELFDDVINNKVNFKLFKNFTSLNFTQLNALAILVHLTASFTFRKRAGLISIYSHKYFV